MPFDWRLMLATCLLLSGCAAQINQPILPVEKLPATKAVPLELTNAAPETVPDSLASFLPQGWVESSPGGWEAQDGSGQAELLDWRGGVIDAACQAAANRERPTRYGSTPEIIKQVIRGWEACAIMPSPDQPEVEKNQAALIVSLPANPGPGGLLVISAPASEINGLAESLRLPEAPAPASSACDFTPWTGDPGSSVSGSLRIDEFQVASGDGCSPLAEPAGFAQRVSTGESADITARLESWQVSQAYLDRLTARLERLNVRLRPFGFEILNYGDNPLRILKDDRLMRDNVSLLGHLTISRDGGRFILPVIDSYNSQSYLLTQDGLQDFERADLLLYDRVFPVLAGDSEISLAYDTQTIPRADGDPALVQVLRDGQVVDTLSISGSNPGGGPVRGLWAWQEQWIVELPGLVVQDGEILNDSLGCQEMFAWRLIADKPFYFCRQDGLVRAFYAGQALPPVFDEVIYQPQVGGAILVQMRRQEDGLAFYARKDGVWLYVVIGLE